MSDLDRGGANADEITYAALVKALDEGAVALVDVREAHEYDAGHVEGSTLNALSAFDVEVLPREQAHRADLPLRQPFDDGAQRRPRGRVQGHLAL